MITNNKMNATGKLHVALFGADGSLKEEVEYENGILLSPTYE